MNRKYNFELVVKSRECASDQRFWNRGDLTLRTVYVTRLQMFRKNWCSGSQSAKSSVRNARSWSALPAPSRQKCSGCRLGPVRAACRSHRRRLIELYLNSFCVWISSFACVGS